MIIYTSFLKKFFLKSQVKQTASSRSIVRARQFEFNNFKFKIWIKYKPKIFPIQSMSINIAVGWTLTRLISLIWLEWPRTSGWFEEVYTWYWPTMLSWNYRTRFVQTLNYLSDLVQPNSIYFSAVLFDITV